MPNEIDITDFASTGSNVTARYKKCLSLPLIKGAGIQTVDTLDKFFDDPAVNLYKKRDLNWAFNRLTEWVAQNGRPFNLTELTRDDLSAFFVSIKNPNSLMRIKECLGAAYKALMEQDIIKVSPTAKPPRPLYPKWPLPKMAVRLGARAIEAITGLLNGELDAQRAKGNATLRAQHLYTLRHLATWCEGQEIFDLKDFSSGDGRLYLQSIDAPRTRATYTYLLHGIFRSLVQAGVLPTNPMPYVVEDSLSRDHLIRDILAVARKTGFAHETALRNFVRNGATEIVCDHRIPALRHFAVWAGYEGIPSLATVTTTHLARYRQLGLHDLQQKTRDPYFSWIGRFFRYLHAQELLETNPAAAFGQGYPSASLVSIDDAERQAYLEFKRSQARAHGGKQPRVLALQYSGNFAELDINSMPYVHRILLARLVRFIARGAEPYGQLNSDPSCVDQLLFKPLGSSPRSPHWKLAKELGVIQVGKGIGRFTPAFVARYSNDNQLCKWADEFLERYRRNTFLYASDVQDKKPSDLPLSRPRHSRSIWAAPAPVH